MSLIGLYCDTNITTDTRLNLPTLYHSLGKRWLSDAIELFCYLLDLMLISINLAK